jgi:MFS family permease
MQRFQQFGAAVRESASLYRTTFTDRNIGLLLGAGFVSEIGDWFNMVTLLALSYEVGAGATGVGGMLAVRMLTRLVVQGPAGSLVDRHPGRRILFASQLLMAVIATAFVLLIQLPALWLLFLLVILLEATNCIARPAFMVELRDEAAEDQRSAANGALFASMTTAQLIGPLLGALVLVPFGPAIVFVLNGVTFLGVAFAVTLLRGGLGGVPAGRRVEEVMVGAAESLVARAPGYRWLLQRRDLALYALVSLCLALLVQATITLFVSRADTLGLGEGGIGIFYSAVASGSIVGSIVAGARSRVSAPLFPAAVAMGLCAVALALFGWASGAALAIAALIIAGFMTDFYEVIGLAYFQQSMPDSVYGRFFSVFLIALSAGGLVGALAGPALEALLGVAPTLAALAAPGLVFAILLAVLAREWQATTVERQPGA